MNELEAHLRSLADHLPEPDEKATAAARAAMRATVPSAAASRRRGRSWFGRARTRPYLLAAAALLAVAGGALAAGAWSLDDLPPFGNRAEEAFVLPSTDILPGGYERTRPPRYSDLPARPGLLFPKGVGYTQALTRYAAARARQQVLPAGVELTDQLPQGKVVMVRDGRVVLDPAAPYGYAATTGLVNTLPRPYDGDALPIARCQLLIGPEDPESPACDDRGVARTYVREGVNGRWVPSPNEEELLDPDVRASTELSVLTDPSVPRITLPGNMGEMLRASFRTPGWGTTRPIIARQAQKVGGVTLVVATAGSRLCLVQIGGGGTGSLCGTQRGFLRRGAAISGGRYLRGPLRLSGLVGDGVTEVRTDNGIVVPVVNNTFTFQPADGIRTLTFSGPIGTFSLPVGAGRDESERFTPDRTRERVVSRIALTGGGYASIRVAPNRGGGRCDWLYILGQVRTSRCTRPSDPPLQYDVVSGGFSPGDRGYPYVYSGPFSPEVGTVEMHFADTTSRRLPITEGFVLFEIPRRNLDRGRWPVAVTTYDRQGVPLVHNTIGDFGQIVRQQGIPR